MVAMTKTQSPNLGLYRVRLSLLKTPSLTRKGDLVSSHAWLFLFLCHRPHGCLPFPLHLTSESRRSISRFSLLSHTHLHGLVSHTTQLMLRAGERRWPPIDAGISSVKGAHVFQTTHREEQGLLMHLLISPGC